MLVFLKLLDLVKHIHSGVISQSPVSSTQSRVLYNALLAFHLWRHLDLRPWDSSFNAKDSTVVKKIILLIQPCLLREHMHTGRVRVEDLFEHILPV